MLAFRLSKPVLFLILLLQADLFPLAAQSRPEIDEEIKVKFLGDWVTGTVLDRKGKEFQVEYFWGNSTSIKVFHRSDIRRMNEVDAMDYSRGWKSANGEFGVEAAMKSFDGNKVILIKPDLTEVTVDINVLSARDIAYIKKLDKQNQRAVNNGMAPARTPELPELESFDSGSMSYGTFSVDSSKLNPLGTIPRYLTEFRQSGMGFTKIRKQQDLIAVIPVGGPEQLVLMTTREDNFHNRGQEFQSQLYWVSLKTKRVVGMVHVTPECHPVDYDPRNKLLLTFHRKPTFDDSAAPDHYVLWKLMPGESKATPVVRWMGKGVGWSESIFAKIVNNRIVVAKTERQTYQAWDVVDKSILYEIKAKSFFDAPVVLSPDRQHLIFPEDGSVSVMDAKTGKVVLSTVVKDRHVSGANINPAGTRLAALTERNIYVWDLATGSTEPTIYPAPLMGSPFSSRVEWIDDDHILGQSSRNRILYRLSLKLPIWSYEMDVHQYFLNKDPLKNMVINGKFFYVAEPDPFSGSIAVGAVQLPGPGVDEVTADIDPESLLLLKPGVRVALDVSGVSQPRKVEDWLIEKIENNGWIYDDRAALVVEAKTGRGARQTVQYQEMGGLGRGKTTSVSFQPYYASLKILDGDTIVWQTGTSTGPPPVIHGGNVQRKVSSYQTPQIQFFKNVEIDSRIIDPKYSRGFGVSRLGLRGIQVVSTSPPGRENDPHDAENKANEDRQKAFEGRRNKDEFGADQNGAENNGGSRGLQQGGVGRGRGRRR